MGCKDGLKGLSGFHLTRMITILIVCWVITLILLFRHRSVKQNAGKQRQRKMILVTNLPKDTKSKYIALGDL